MNRDLLSAGFLLAVLGVGIMIWWSRKDRSNREATIGRLAGGA